MLCQFHPVKCLKREFITSLLGKYAFTPSRVPSLCKYDWAKLNFYHANLHKKIGQKQCYTATPNFVCSHLNKIKFTMHGFRNQIDTYLYRFYKTLPAYNLVTAWERLHRRLGVHTNNTLKYTNINVYICTRIYIILCTDALHQVLRNSSTSSGSTCISFRHTCSTGHCLHYIWQRQHKQNGKKK